MGKATYFDGVLLYFPRRSFIQKEKIYTLHHKKKFLKSWSYMFNTYPYENYTVKRVLLYEGYFEMWTHVVLYHEPFRFVWVFSKPPQTKK